MKRIAIFCDGTWNNKDRTDHPTSIGRLSELFEAPFKAADGVEQIGHYEEGLGANDGLKGFKKFADKLVGGSLGRGLTEDIVNCYRFLIENYEKDDQIYIFGFSRGAYTARSLVGLLRSSGLPNDVKHIVRALDWYRDRSDITHPRSDESNAHRLEISPEYWTRPSEKAWRQKNGHIVGAELNVAYLGVFDTVGAHGIAGVLGQFRMVPGGHGFHDHELSSLVKSGRHAMGLDETRVLYRPTKWRNVDPLNTRAGPDATGGARYRQLWFPGSHGKVGGSGKERRLSNAIMDWIVEGARVADLDVPVPSDLLPQADDFAGELHNESSGFDPTGVARWRRRGPRADEVDLLHEAAELRLVWRSDYRPASLQSFLLDGVALAELRQIHGHRFA